MYGLGLNNTVLLDAIGYTKGSTLYEKLLNQATGIIVLAAAGALPGSITAILTLDTIGRKPVQLFGFLSLAVLFAILGFLLDSMSTTVLLALYVAVMFLFNMGPNSTTFIVAGEVFPTRYRSMGHGASAAIGKIGALIAQGVSVPLLRKSQVDCIGAKCAPHLDTLFKIFALIMFLGAVATLFIPETKGVTLEELAGEPPTSYNSGRNGSVHAVQKNPWNPFSGGQPAGFNYTKKRCGKVGIMTSPRVAQATPPPKRRYWPWKGGDRSAGSDASDDLVVSDRNSSGNDAASQPPANQVPNWGAGWGRIDRGTPQAPLENLRMEDVSGLLTAKTSATDRPGSPRPREA